VEADEVLFNAMSLDGIGLSMENMLGKHGVQKPWFSVNHEK